MSIHTSAGTVIAIWSGTPATFNKAGYNALDASFLPIGEITNAGEFGRVYQLVTHNPLATRGTRKFKGSFNEGTMNLQLALDTDDPGQVLGETALNDDDDYSFRVTMQNGDKYYFQAKVMSFPKNVGGVNDMTNATMQLELTTNAAGVGIVPDLIA